MPIAYLQPTLQLIVADETDTIAYTQLYIDAGATVAAGRAAMAVLRGVLPTTATVVGGALRWQVDELAAVRGGGSVFRCGLLLFRTITPGQLGLFCVPGIYAQAVDTEDNTRLNLLDPGVNALVQELTSGFYCNPFGHVLTECIAGFIELRET